MIFVPGICVYQYIYNDGQGIPLFHCTRWGCYSEKRIVSYCFRLLKLVFLKFFPKWASRCFQGIGLLLLLFFSMFVSFFLWYEFWFKFHSLIILSLVNLSHSSFYLVNWQIYFTFFSDIVIVVHRYLRSMDWGRRLLILHFVEVYLVLVD